MMKNMLNFIRGGLAERRLTGDRLINLVLEEKKSGYVDEVADAKALLDAKGDRQKADTLYFKYRIQRLKDLEAVSNKGEMNKSLETSFVQEHSQSLSDEQTVEAKNSNKFSVFEFIALVLAFSTFLSIIFIAWLL